MEKRLIDADAVLEELKRMEVELIYTAVVVKDAPTIDAVPVVRCKDCKHRIKWNDSFGCSFWGYYGDEFADGEMFCSKGERKDDE